MEILEKTHNANQPMPTIQSLANEWLTPQQLEAELGISAKAQEKMRMQRRQLNEDNPIPFSKYGKYIRYNRSKINEWLLRCTMKVNEVA